MTSRHDGTPRTRLRRPCAGGSFRLNVCAVIPAAGRGSRLGRDGPKLLVPVSDHDTIWAVLRKKLRSAVDHIHVVLSPAGVDAFEEAMKHDPDWAMVSVSVQPQPIGMGDAIFRGHHVWSQAKVILVVWGDQVHVSQRTICASLDLHEGAEGRVVLPLVSVPDPYVEYRFSGDGRLVAILQSREGDRCQPGGLSDVGTFVLSTGGLRDRWSRFLIQARAGARTGEVNFLPFLTFLAQEGWDVKPLEVTDPLEARGINTPEDLTLFRTIYMSSSRGDEREDVPRRS